MKLAFEDFCNGAQGAIPVQPDEPPSRIETPFSKVAEIAISSLSSSVRPAQSPRVLQDSQQDIRVRLALDLLNSVIDDAFERLGSSVLWIAAETNVGQLNPPAIPIAVSRQRAFADSLSYSIAQQQAMIVELEQSGANGQAVHKRLSTLLEATGDMISVLTDLLKVDFHESSKIAARTENHAENKDALARLRKLTAQEKRIVELLSQGLPNKLIAYELGIADTTVKKHVGNILRKLRVPNRARVIAMFVNRSSGA